jgi:hypothetical protein
VAEGEQPPLPPTPPPEPGDESARRFKSAADATSELHDHFGAWTGGLGKYGLQVVFALMAANWALHGSDASLLHNTWARSSMVVAVLYLGLLLLSMGFMVLLSWQRREYADEDKKRWAAEFKKSADGPSPWPYTETIERLGNVMAVLHVLGPLLSGTLLLASIFATPLGAPSAGASGGAAASQACCARIADDVAAIRRSVDSFAVAGGSDETTVVKGDSELRLPGWTIVASGLLILLAGTIVFFASTDKKAEAAGAALAGIGLTLSLGGVALVKELKIESLFTFKTDRLFDNVHKEIAAVGASGPERLGFIDRFRLGDDQLLDRAPGTANDVADSEEVSAMLKAWRAKRKEGMDGVLLVIGATDRLPINGAKRQQFEANVSLARARAEAVKSALVKKCEAPECEMNADHVIVLVSGPVNTPDRAHLSPAATRDGYPQDRRVDVWAIWTRRPVETKR